MPWIAALCAAMFLEPGVAPQGRIASLERKLLAPCCWSETVAVHRSPVALEMKNGIRALVGQGRTDREILDYYKAKYGARILIEPEGGTRMFANAVPWIAAALGVVALAAAIRKMTRNRPAPVPAAALPEMPDDDW
jgi:cytochrome c-type biogenesis protein CcmH